MSSLVVLIAAKCAHASYLFGDTPEDTATLACEAIDLGLSAVKFGWGPFDQDADGDVVHVHAAREALGDERELMIDASHAWDWQTALERARLLAPFNLAWLKEPPHRMTARAMPSFARNHPSPSLPVKGM